MAVEIEPNAELARRVLPLALQRALQHLYAGGNDDAVLVGGTAIAGYYAGHRRSDDLDLFTRNPAAFEALRRRVPTLEELGATVLPQHTTPGFHRSLAKLEGHTFTIDVVLDENIFRVGRASVCDGITVASLPTLLMCKAATLVSRCSEKDLYDLSWMCSRDKSAQPREIVRLGQQIDAGVSAESILIALTSTDISEKSCDFALPDGPSPAEIFKELCAFKESLQDAFAADLEHEPPPALARTIALLKKQPRTK